MRVGELVSKFRVWGVAGLRNYVSDCWRWRLFRRRLTRLLRERTETRPVRGITVIGDLSGGASNSKTLRDFILSLRDAGIPCQTYNTRLRPLIPESEFRDLETPREEFDIRKYTHIVEMFRSPLPWNPVKVRARIAFWEGEHGILDVWPWLAGSDPVIGMSDFNVSYFRRELKGTKVCKILYPLRRIRVEPRPAAEIRRQFGLAADDFVVFFNFDFGSFRRKNPHAAIRAFARAFADVLDARLVFKTMGARTHAAEVAELRALAVAEGIADRLTLITDYLPHEELYGLTNACDVYLSLHRGEGFGIGMAEAMLFGKPVVATDWSASTEFVREGVACPVPFRLVPVRADEYFVSMGEWAEADVDSAAQILRRLHDDPVGRKALGERARAFVNDHFSIENFKASVEAFLNDSP